MTKGSSTSTSSEGLSILAIHRYFWPDTPPYASLLRTITSSWTEAGHRVIVFTAQPSYKKGVTISRQPPKDVLDGVGIRRIPLPEESNSVRRIVNMLVFAVASFLRIVTGRYDFVMISTVPQVIGAFSACLAATISRKQFVYHCMDVQPEIAELIGDIRSPGLIWLLKRIDSWVCNTADRVIVLSEDMASSIRARAPKSNLVVINNFSLPAFTTEEIEPSAELAKRSGGLRLIFAGNLGRFQGLESLVDAMRLVPPSIEVELLFLGDGRLREHLRQMAEDLPAGRIRFLPHQPVHVARAIIRSADLGIVSLIPEMSRYAFPSKTMTYLEEGCPVMVISEADSDLARVVREDGSGLIVPPGDPEGLSKVIEELAARPQMISEMRSRAPESALRRFDRSRILDRWRELIVELERERRGIAELAT